VEHRVLGTPQPTHAITGKQSAFGRANGRGNSVHTERRLSATRYATFALMATAFALAVYALPLTYVGHFSPAVVIVLSLTAIIVSTVITFSIATELFIIFWIALAMFQNFAVGIFLSDRAAIVPIYISESKTIAATVAILMMLPVALSNMKRFTHPLRWYAVYAVVVLGHVTSLGGATLPYLRNFLLPLATLLLVVAMTAGWGEKRRLDLASAIVRFGTVILAVGTFCEMLAGAQTWRTILHADKNSALNSLSTVTNFFGWRIERTGGFLVEPTNAGYIAAALIIIAVILVRSAGPQHRSGMYLCAVFCFWVLLMSGAKSGLLMLLIAATSAIAYSRAKSVWGGLTLGWIGATVLVAAYVAAIKGPAAIASAVSNPLSILGGDSTTYHFAGFIAGLKHAFTSILGGGIGVGGNFARIAGATNSQWILTGGESSWGVLAYQAGLLGIILFLATIASLCKHLGIRSAILISAWSSSAMFAEALFGPQVAGVILVVAALLLSDSAVRSRHDNNVGAERLVQQEHG